LCRCFWVDHIREAGDAYRTGRFSAPIFALLSDMFVVLIRRDEVIGPRSVRIDRNRDRTGELWRECKPRATSDRKAADMVT